MKIVLYCIDCFQENHLVQNRAAEKRAPLKQRVGTSQGEFPWESCGVHRQQKVPPDPRPEFQDREPLPPSNVSSASLQASTVSSRTLFARKPTASPRRDVSIQIT